MDGEAHQRLTRTGGRPATEGVIRGRYALSVGDPGTPAPSGWRWLPLSQLARLETGHTPSRRRPEWWGGNIPWISIKDATSNHGRTIQETAENTNAQGIANSSARVLPAETVCLSRTASVGYVVVMGRPMATSQDFVNWVCGKDLDYRFLKYVLLAEKDALLQYASGTTHQTIYFPEVKAFHICVPDRHEQGRVAELLGALDDKIEINRRMAETLEATARALFKSWFLDFDPVRAKAEGRPTGLPEALATLFPDRFGDDGLPDGWRFSPVGELFEVVGGNTPSTSEASFWDGPHAWATPKDLSSLSTPILLSTERRISDAGLARVSSGLLPAGSLLLSSRAPIGYMAFAVDPVAINQGFAGFIRRNVTTAYAWLWCQANMELIRGNASGSTFPEISKGVLRGLPMLEPKHDILGAFSNTLDPVVERLVALAKESRTLAALRDTLIPKLISGELRIRDAERSVVAA